MKKKYNLFLDDVRIPKHVFDYTSNPIYNQLNWEVVRNYNEFVKLIEKKGLPKYISFDHDLASEHYHQYKGDDEKYNELYDQYKDKTGYDCAKWLVDYCMDNNLSLTKNIFVHSMNPVGKKNIQLLFANFHKWCESE